MFLCGFIKKEVMNSFVDAAGLRRVVYRSFSLGKEGEDGGEELLVFFSVVYCVFLCFKEWF
jgi:hypothetical protein